MTIRMFGISNCDTVRKARAWLDAHGVTYEFHDYKKAGIDRETLAQWVDAHGWETILNRAGTTFRKLPEDERADLDTERAVRLMVAQPSMIKRPILEIGGQWIVGFKPDVYHAALEPA